MTVDRQGNLVLETPAGRLIQGAPHIYQVVSGRRVPLRGGFVLRAQDEVGFEVAGRDPSAPLVIDPEVVFATYLGGSGSEFPAGSVPDFGVATDGAGHVFVVGTTMSSDFPPPDATTLEGSSDAFVARYDLTDLQNPRLEWARFLGGAGRDYGADVVATADGGAYVVGTTDSNNFPTTPGSYLADAGTGPAERGFIARLNASGQVTKATYLGMSTGPALYIEGVALDEAGGSNFAPGVYVIANAYGGGYATPGAYQQVHAGFSDAVVAKLNLDLTAPLIYLTYLGGSSRDLGRDIAVREGKAYVVGSTSSLNFPVTSGVVQPQNGTTSPGDCIPGDWALGCFDGFAAALDPAGGGLIFGTYLGGPALDGLGGIALNDAGHATVVGWKGGPDPSTQILVGRLQPNGQGYSREFGGMNGDSANAVVLDGLGRAHLTGSTSSQGLATGSTPPSIYAGGSSDGFLATLSQSDQVTYFRYLGGSGPDYAHSIALGRDGILYIAGATWSSNFPTVSPVQATLGGEYDAFLVSMQERPRLTLQKLDDPDPATVGEPLTYTISVTNDGWGEATGATLRDQLPANADLQGYPPSCSWDSFLRTLTCPLGNIGPGAQTLGPITVQPTAEGEACNTATLTVAESPQPITAQQCTTVRVPPLQGSRRQIAFVDHDPAANQDVLKVYRLEDSLLQFDYRLTTSAIGVEYDSTGESLAVIEPGKVTVLNAQDGSSPTPYPGAYVAVAFRPSDRRDLAFVRKPIGGSGSYSLMLWFGSTGMSGEQPLLPSIAPSQTMGEPRIAWSPDGQWLTAAFTVTEANGDNRLYFAEWAVLADQFVAPPAPLSNWPVPNWTWEEDPLWRLERVRAVANPAISLDPSWFQSVIATNHGFYRMGPFAFDLIPIVIRRIGAIDFDVNEFMAAFLTTFPQLAAGGPSPTLGVLLAEGGVVDGPTVGTTPVAFSWGLRMVAVTEPNAVVLYRIVSNQPPGPPSFVRDISFTTVAPRARHLAFRPLSP
jgi:uncharacterized repeat protein (TIGR01451 family)